MISSLARVRRIGAVLVLAFWMISSALHATAAALDLAGTWRFQLDRQNVGSAERWFARPLNAAIELPGSLAGRRIGDPVTADTKWTGGIFDRSYFAAPEYAPYRQPGNIKVPFWLQPEKYYVGVAWFQRDIEIPAAWTGRRIALTLERPHWKTALWLDSREIGSNDALSVAHDYDLGTDVAPGRHVLTIRVDNTLVPDIGENSHSVTDHTQGNWNGIVGRIELTATAPAWIDDLQVYPDLRANSVRVTGRVGGAGFLPPGTAVSIQAALGSASGGPLVAAPLRADGSFNAEYPLGAGAWRWDEFTPALYSLTATLVNGETKTVMFGLREMGSVGRQLTINGRPLFLRGTLDCAAFPRTGYPPLDVESWRRELRTIQAHGLNHVRFHSWCPPEAAFVAADELGVYLQVEAASWPNQSTTLGDGKPVDAWLEAETARILRAYGNHPSFAFFSSCNEPGGEHAGPWLRQWVARHKSEDPRRLFTTGSGWPEVPENQYEVNPQPRIQHWGEGLDSRINHLPPETRSDYRDFINARSVPVISHEIGQWCVYPNFAEIPKYTGYLKPRNFEIFRDTLSAHHLADQARDFLIASGKLQVLCYKEEIESALRTPEMGGFQLLALSDFPGQGTALVGVLDAFWEEKGYVTPTEFRRFCNRTVPLARLDRRVFTSDEHLVAEVEVAHFGAAPLVRTVASWKLAADNGRVIARGQFEPRDIPVGAGNALGRVDLALDTVPVPARYKLVVSLEGTAFENDWEVWVYPPAARVATAPPANVLLTSAWDAAARAKLETGGTVWLMLPPARVRPDPTKGPVALGFSSIFWNTAWTHRQAPHTLGILCDPRHPALSAFPTDAFSNWQWWYPIRHAAAMILDSLPAELHPTVQVVDDWFTNRKLALIFEARIGRGKLLVSSIDLGGASLDPVRRQLRASLTEYIASPRFNPSVVVTAGQVRGLIAE
jgi:hypothetical protein